MGIKHSFASLKLDGPDTSVVRPSNWNADHTIDGDVDLNGFALLQPKLGGNLDASGFAIVNPKLGLAFDVLADVAAQSIPTEYNEFQVYGYTTVGDGGGGLYRRVAVQPIHAGKAQSLDGAWWELYGDYINVKQFGAKGDNLTDDTIAIQNAISYLETSGTTGILWFPVGVYLTTTTITVSKSGISLKGEQSIVGAGSYPNLVQLAPQNAASPYYALSFDPGAGAEIIGWGLYDICIFCGDNANVRGLQAINAVWGRGNNILVQSVCDQAISLTGDGIHSCWGNRFDHVWIQMSNSAPNFASSLIITGTVPVDSFLNYFDHLHIQMKPSSSGVAIALAYCDTNLFSNVTVNPAGNTAIRFDYTVDPNAAFPGGNQFRGIEMYNNSISNVGAPATTNQGQGNYINGFALGNGAQPQNVVGLYTETMARDVIKLHLGSAQSVAGLAVVNVDNTDANTSNYASAVDLANHYIIPRIAGWYVIQGQVTCDSFAGASVLTAQLVQNLTTAYASGTATNNGNAATVNLSGLAYFNGTSDSLQLYAGVSGGSTALTIGISNTWVSAHGPV